MVVSGLVSIALPGQWVLVSHTVGKRQSFFTRFRFDSIRFADCVCISRQREEGVRVSRVAPLFLFA